MVQYPRVTSGSSRPAAADHPRRSVIPWTNPIRSSRACTTPAPRPGTSNWEELLQELRVTQTGVQILAGFLLTIPFQPRFGELDGTQRGAYLVALAAVVVATTCLVAPVSAHRLLFHRHARGRPVDFADRAARAGLAALAVCFTAAAFLVADVVVSRPVGMVTAVVVGLFFTIGWVVLPLLLRRHLTRTEPR